MMPALSQRNAPVSVALPRLRVGGRKMAELPVWSVNSPDARPDGPFVAVVPGASIPLVRLDLPAGLRGDARETVGRRQVQDRLGLGPHQMEMRPAPLAGQGALWQAMLMASPADLARWRDNPVLRDRNLRAILPDYLALPSAEGVWTIQTGALPDSPVQMRLGPTDGLSAEADLAALTLSRALLDTPARPRAILRLGPALPALDAALDAAHAQHPEITLASRIEDLPSGLARPLRFGHGELALDLARQRPDARMALQTKIRGLFLPGAILLIAGLIWTATHVLDVRRLDREVQARSEDIVALVRREFLPAGPLPDIRLQVLRLLDERRAALDDPTSGAPRPLTLMRQASAVLADGDIRLDAMRLQSDASIVIELTSPDFTTLEALIVDLRAAGLKVVPERSASDGDGSVLGTMTLMPGPAAGVQP